MIREWTPVLEKELIEKAKKEPESFGEVYQHYFEPIYRYVSLKVSGDPAVSNELVSNVFYKALVKLDRYDEERLSFAPWLYKIALNEVRMHFRKSKTGNFLFRIEDLQGALDMEQGATDDPLDKEQMARHLSFLSDEELSIIELRFYEDLSFKELGQVFNKSEEAVKMKTYRILSKLKKRISKS